MSTILIVDSATDGHAVKTGPRPGRVIEPLGHAVTRVATDAATSTALQACEAIVIDASIRYGTHGRAVIDFINRRGRLRDRRPKSPRSRHARRKPGGPDARGPNSHDHTPGRGEKLSRTRR